MMFYFLFILKKENFLLKSGCELGRFCHKSHSFRVSRNCVNNIQIVVLHVHITQMKQWLNIFLYVNFPFSGSCDVAKANTWHKTTQKMLYKYNLKQSAVWFWLSTFEESGNKMEWQQIKNKMRKKKKKKNKNEYYIHKRRFVHVSISR